MTILLAQEAIRFDIPNADIKSTLPKYRQNDVVLMILLAISILECLYISMS
jgi:hypothetical protein